MASKKAILEYLKGNPIENSNIIHFIENYPIRSLEKIGNSVVAKGTSDRDWVYISSKSSLELKMIQNHLTAQDCNFAIIEDWMIPILCGNRNIKWKLSTLRLFLPETVPLPAPLFHPSALTVNDAEVIYHNSAYQQYLSLEYIGERIRNGMGSCLRERDNAPPVAWALTQDDGAIGFLNVLPEHRNKGYARAVTIDMIQKVRAQNRLPFVLIEADHTPSMRLALSLGFVQDRMVSWFEVED